jgi:radical SAM-linked protein
MTRARIRYAKLGKLRWTSHRDTARMWERAFRRLGVPLAYTGGFSPRPRISFGLALPTGCESWAEYLDVEMEGEPDLAEMVGAVSAALPTGVDAMGAAAVPDGEGSLQQEVVSCEWELSLSGAPSSEVSSMVEAALGASALPVRRERKGRSVEDDLRPAIVSLAVLGAVGPATVVGAELTTQPRGVRPLELLEAMRGTLKLDRACRTRQWIERDGARREPIPAGATGAPHAWERAS